MKTVMHFVRDRCIGAVHEHDSMLAYEIRSTQLMNHIS